MIRHSYPYTNFHDLNLDWIVQRLEELNFPETTAEEIKGILDRLTNIEGKLLTYDANFQTINQRLEELYGGIIQMTAMVNDINRTVV